MKQKEIVLFGTGCIGERTEKIMRELCISVNCYADNDPTKQGFLNGKKVLSPESLINIDCDVIVANAYFHEIKAQLNSLGFKNNIYNYSIVSQWALEKIIPELSIPNNLEAKVKAEIKEKSVIIDNISTVSWGGAEQWAINVAEGLHSYKGINTCIACNKDQKTRLEDYECEQWFCESANTSYLESIKECASFFLSKIPFTLVSSRIDIAYYAALATRHFFPEQVRIINAQHSSRFGNYNSSTVCDQIDKTIATSSKIYNSLLENYKIPPNKIVMKENALIFDKEDALQSKTYSCGKLPIRIAFAARLEVLQKRTDLLLNLVELLEKHKVNYEINIAGRGSYEEKLRDYIKEKKLGNKIKMLGVFEADKLKEYWKKQDVYLNLSDFEGMSLAMLEAMLYGVVPVVTDVSGVSDVITHGYNGYVSCIQDISDIANNIKSLDENRHLLEVFGSRSKDIILEKCDYRKYIEFMAEEIEKLW